MTVSRGPVGKGPEIALIGRVDARILGDGCEVALFQCGSFGSGSPFLVRGARAGFRAAAFRILRLWGPSRVGPVRLCGLFRCLLAEFPAVVSFQGSIVRLQKEYRWMILIYWLKFL